MFGFELATTCGFEEEMIEAVDVILAVLSLTLVWGALVQVDTPTLFAMELTTTCDVAAVEMVLVGLTELTLEGLREVIFVHLEYPVDVGQLVMLVLEEAAFSDLVQQVRVGLALEDV